MKKKGLIKFILIINTVCRIIAPFFIFISPLTAFLLIFLFDSFDGQLFYRLRYKWNIYNLFDKILDFWWYIFIIIFMKNSPLFPIALVLFIYRGIGQFMGILSGNEKIYMYFPNILEWFFLLSLFFPKNIITILFISTFWSLFVEWLIHKSNTHLISKFIFHNEIKWNGNH